MPNTLVKGLQILDWLQQRPSATLTEISAALHYNKTTTYRLLDTLIGLNKVQKNQRQYAVVQPDLPQLNWLAVTVTQQLVQQFHVTAYIGVLQQADVVITQVIPTAIDTLAYRKLGKTVPFYESALGKAIVANLPAPDQAFCLQQLQPTARTKFTLNDRQALIQNLALINAQGYALDDEESTLGLRCLAVPLQLPAQVQAALAISGNFNQLPRRQFKQLAQALQTCRDTLAVQWG
jgi:DNA-binding IclR family transcriptional regulator